MISLNYIGRVRAYKSEPPSETNNYKETRRMAEFPNKLRYFKIDKDNLVNGPGIRYVLWTTGCNHFCRGCHNPETWAHDFGSLMAEDDMDSLLVSIDKPYIQGLTITGGDPFFPANISGIQILLNKFREKFGNTKDIWVWTGYSFETLTNNYEPEIDGLQEIMHGILKMVNVIVDGMFDEKQRRLDIFRKDSEEVLKYRGSSNQRVIDVQKSLKASKIVEFE